MVAEIKSLHHPLIKEWVKIRSEKTARQEINSVLIAGEKMVRELSQKIPLKTLITTEENHNIRAENVYLVTDGILQKITGLPSPDGFAAIAPLPKPQSMAGKNRILILDQISDPGNLGTLLRAALALNWDGVVFTPNTVDPFNDKALRASKGAIFTLPFAHLTPEEILNVKPLYMVVADLDGTPLSTASFKTPLALILSNEGAGPSPWAKESAQSVAIPMHNEVDSLNVATCGAILLYIMGAK